jgi:hypothetical protein
MRHKASPPRHEAAPSCLSLRSDFQAGLKKDRNSIQPNTEKTEERASFKPGESAYLSNALTMIVGESGEENR